MLSHKKKQHHTVLLFFNFARYAGLAAAGTRRSATRATAAEIYAGVDFKSISHEIDCNWRGFFIKFFVHDEFETVDFIGIIGVFRLIQSHCQ
jgi:hypothetical protein